MLLTLSEVDSSILEFGLVPRCKSKIKNKVENRVDPDETALYELSYLDLHCLQRHWFWSARLKGLKG